MERVNEDLRRTLFRRLSTSALAALILMSPMSLQAEPAPGVISHVMSQAAQSRLLLDLLREVRFYASEGKTPVVVFDLDDTLFINGPRHQAILVDFFSRSPQRFGDLAQQVAAANGITFPYSLAATLALFNITDPALVDEAYGFWTPRFFGSDYLRYDLPIRGGQAYVRRLHRAGASIVYLTGRPKATMEEGTVASLKAYGFPYGDRRSTLMMKPSKTKDVVFKRSVAIRLRARGTPVAFFDNEPRNCNLFLELFPRAQTVFLATNHSPGAEPVAPGIPGIRSFRIEGRLPSR